MGCANHSRLRQLRLINAHLRENASALRGEFPRLGIWISLSNLFLILISVGLLLPWAKVRMYKYLSAMTFVTAIGNIDTFIDELNSNRSSIGEAVSDLEGVEVAI